MTVANFKSDAAKREKNRVLRDFGFVRDDVVAVVHFVHEPVLQLQHGIFVFALGDGDMLHRTVRSGLAPTDRNSGLHRHAEPELAAGCGRALQGDTRILRKSEQEVGIVPD